MSAFEDLIDQWQKASDYGLEAHLTISDRGLVLGAGTILAEYRPDAQDVRNLALDGRENQILALLAVAYWHAVPPSVLENFRRAAKAYARGEKVAAHMHLAFTGLHGLEDEEPASLRLFLAERLLTSGMSPGALLAALGINQPKFIARVVKASADDPKHPGWPAGTPGGVGGEYRPKVPGASEQDQKNKSLRLPSGKRIDELGDLVEWIANARPEDERAIRAEIKRLYYDVGDTHGGDALNEGLSDVLADDGNLETRKDVLEGLEPYTRSDPAQVGQMARDLLPGVLLFPPGVAPSIAPATVAASNVWELGWAARGRQIEEELGANLGRNFPVIDRFADGVATSIKSVNLNAGVYQDATRLSVRLNAYVDQLSEFGGLKWAGVTINSAEITGKILNLAVPKDAMTAEQAAAIAAAQTRALGLGVNLVVMPF